MRSLPLAIARDKPMQQLRPRIATKEYIYKVEESTIGLAGTEGMELGYLGILVGISTVVKRLLKCLKQQLLGKNVQDSPFCKPEKKSTGKNQ